MGWSCAWLLLHSLPLEIVLIDWAPPCWDPACLVMNAPKSLPIEGPWIPWSP